ncbi:MAG: polysaccharide deacetylase family protein [Candidatus Heimdallarchaeota archaeon]
MSLPFHSSTSNIWANPAKHLLKGTIQALKELIELFQDNSWPANLFFEASIINELAVAVPQLSDFIRRWPNDLGIHGLHHEDLSGEETGVFFSKNQEAGLISAAIKLVLNLFGRRPIGFRAPYLRLSPHTHDILVNQGFRYDSSQIITTDSVPQIYRLPVPHGTIFEVPIVRYPTKDSPFVSYFWSLFERIRSADEIIEILKTIIRRSISIKKPTKLPRVLTLNLHPWHLAFSVKNKTYFTEEEFKTNRKNLFLILKSLEEWGKTEFTTLSEIVPSTDS